MRRSNPVLRAVTFLALLGAVVVASLATYAGLEAACPPDRACEPDSHWAWTATLGRASR